MNAFKKFCYLGPWQTARKYLLKVECAANAGQRPPVLPAQDPSLDLKLKLLGHEFDLSAPHRWHGSWPLIYGPALALDREDVKPLWELNRHQFLPSLDKELARRIVRDWIAQNPYPFGINWNSPLEAALRMIAWIETFGREEFAEALAQHAQFIRHHLSSDWVPRNNHLIGEAAALSLYEGRPHRWLRQAAREQFFASGVHREQSVAYHRFVTHLFSVAGLSQPKSLAYLGAICQPDGTLPDIGDNDDAFASTRSLELPAASTGSVAFPDAGHYVIRHGGDYCFVRCGGFGLPPTYSHGHADLMSPVLWLQGQPVFVDAGTFTYNGDAGLRRIFRSAFAHNVVMVDDVDFGEQAGTFVWHNPLRGICEAWSEREFVGSVGTWRRRIACDNGRFLISDSIAGSGRHQVRWRFHLHPQLKVSRCNDGVIEFGDRFALRVKSEGANVRIGRGWYSATYGARVPVEVCEILFDGALPAAAEFVVEVVRG